MNMLRVWGGGFYEEDRFYDLCDRYGLLIWQDFIFACGVYPEDDAFAENVRQEAIENVRRLRHRASLALWCGNNEMEQGWVDWKWNDPEKAAVPVTQSRLRPHVPPPAAGVVEAEDPDRPYWPSSASSGVAFANPNGQLRGDTHYWDVWHGRKPFTAYRQQFPRFMSEFGFQALPPLKTIHTYAEAKDQNMTSYVMEHHQRSPAGNGLMVGQMTETFRMPKDFHGLVYLSLVLQAEGIRYGVEHWRRNRDRVSGTLIWQLNDCWPVASWSSIDYFGRWKALHYAARKFYAPVLLSIEDKAEVMDLFVTNDTVRAWTGEVRWSLQTTRRQTVEERDREGLRQGAGCRLDLPSGFQQAGERHQPPPGRLCSRTVEGHEIHLPPGGCLRPQQAPGTGRPAHRAQGLPERRTTQDRVDSPLAGPLRRGGVGRRGCGLQRQLLRPARRAARCRHLSAAAGLEPGAGAAVSQSLFIG